MQIAKLEAESNEKSQLIKSVSTERDLNMIAFEKLMVECKELRESEKINSDRLLIAEKNYKKEKKNADILSEANQGLKSAYERMKTGFEPIESTLSCLSCLSFLKEPKPLTLICGHSICKNCFNQHSDPKSADSLVFCEECKIETKNKQLKDSKVM